MTDQRIDQLSDAQAVTVADTVIGLQMQSGVLVPVQIPLSMLTIAPQKMGGPPTSGAWKAGDKVDALNPTAGGPEGWICVQDGTPGTWAPRGNVGPNVNVAPTQYSVSVVSPASGANVSGVTAIQVQTAGMVDVEIYNGTAFLIHAPVPSSGITTLNLDTSLLPNGSNALTIKAQDTAYGGAAAPAHTAQTTLNVVVNNGAGNVSAAGTTIPGAAQIVDNSGNVITLQSAQVYMNGAALGFSSGVTEIYWDGTKPYQTNGSGWWYWDYANKAWVSTSNPAPSPSAKPPAIAGTALSLAYDLSAKIAGGTLSVASNTSTSAADLYGGLWYEAGFDLSSEKASLASGILSINANNNLCSCDHTGTHGFTIPAMSSLTADGYYVEFIVAYNSKGGDSNGAGMGVWLEGVNHLSGTYPASEQDVHEDYGQSASPGTFVATLHTWSSSNTEGSPQVQDYQNLGQDTATYHKYAMWAKSGVRHYYLDDAEIPGSPKTPFSVNDTDKHFVVLSAEVAGEVLSVKSVKVWK